MAYEALRSLVVGKINNATLKEIEKSLRGDEQPEFILSEPLSGAGTLVAFQDRCLVIKKGVLTSLMTSSLGGGRTATFAYADITGIEFNSGLVMGQLEILTASYTGKKTNSVWSFGKENSAYEMSNVLPWANDFYKKVRPQIEWLKQRVQEVKSSDIHTESKSVSDELEKLGRLHAKGILSDAEFAEAKAKIITLL